MNGGHFLYIFDMFKKIELILRTFSILEFQKWNWEKMIKPIDLEIPSY